MKYTIWRGSASEPYVFCDDFTGLPPRVYYYRHYRLMDPTTEKVMNNRCVENYAYMESRGIFGVDHKMDVSIVHSKDPRPNLSVVIPTDRDFSYLKVNSPNFFMNFLSRESAMKIIGVNEKLEILYDCVGKFFLETERHFPQDKLFRFLEALKLFGVQNVKRHLGIASYMSHIKDVREYSKHLLATDPEAHGLILGGWFKEEIDAVS
jgi:hypothetical protein